MEIRIDEIGVGPYRFSLLVPAPPTGSTFSEVPSDGEEPPLFRCGKQQPPRANIIEQSITSESVLHYSGPGPTTGSTAPSLPALLGLTARRGCPGISRVARVETVSTE